MAAEEVADSWEDINNEDLDKQLGKLIPPVDVCIDSAIKNSIATVPSVPKLEEESVGRTPYQPTVRILKRETNNAQNNASSTVQRLASKPIRTLEEREAAYAEARLRILGSACSPDDEEADNADNSSQPADLPSNLSDLGILTSSKSNEHTAAEPTKDTSNNR